VEIFGERQEENYKNKKTAPKLKTIGDTLFFVLFQLKNDLVNDTLGLIFKMNGSNANRNFEKYLAILKATLKRNKTYPKRYFKSLKEFEECFKNEKEIIIDGEEQGVERPEDADCQKDRFSGKKKRHTEKSMVITNNERKIYYISELYVGSAHDYSILKTELPPDINWFRNLKVRVDLGFLGIAKDYVIKMLEIPFKKPYKSKSNPDPQLTKEQKEYNKEVSKVRIYVEHAIGGLKRYRVLINRNRLKKYSLKNDILGICAGLWNFKIKAF